MQIGIISDIHIKTYKKNSKFLNQIVETCEFFYEECKRRKVEEVFILGDMFHVKSRVELDALSISIDLFRKHMKQFKHTLIVGNHDRQSYENNFENFTKVFNTDATVVDNYHFKDYGDNRFHFLAYAEDLYIKKRLSDINVYGKNNYLFGHFAFQNFSYDNGHEDVYSELTDNDINPYFKHIFSGHYHEHQTKGRITYVSAPMQHNYGDKADGHGFVFFDSNKPDKYEFFQNPIFPKFVTFELNKANLAKYKNIENSYIRLVIKKKIEQKLIEQICEQLMVNNHDVKLTFDIKDEAMKISTIKNWDEIVYTDINSLFKEYVNNIDTQIPKDALLKFIEVT